MPLGGRRSGRAGGRGRKVAGVVAVNALQARKVTRRTAALGATDLVSPLGVCALARRARLWIAVGATYGLRTHRMTSGPVGAGQALDNPFRVEDQGDVTTIRRLKPAAIHVRSLPGPCGTTSVLPPRGLRCCAGSSH